MGPDLRSILFENTYHFLLKTVCFAWNYFNSENIDLCQFYKMSQNFFEGTVFLCLLGTHWGYEILSMLLKGKAERETTHKDATSDVGYV